VVLLCSTATVTWGVATRLFIFIPSLKASSAFFKTSFVGFVIKTLIDVFSIYKKDWRPPPAKL
jgi:hypothetical protein